METKEYINRNFRTTFWLCDTENEEVTTMANTHSEIKEIIAIEKQL
jgi:hypothetical protein